MNLKQYFSGWLRESDETQEGAHEAPSSISSEDEAPGPLPEGEAPTEAVVEAVDAIDADPLALEVTLQEEALIELTGRVWEAVIIREGLSINGRFYTRECLEHSIPLWEGEDVCDYGWAQPGVGVRDASHIPVSVERGFPLGTYRNQIGILRNVRGRIREGRYELVAEICVTDPVFRQKALDNHKMGGRPPGLSIHAYGEGSLEVREGRQVQVVHRLSGTRELTVVSKPAAGGAFERLVAAETQTPEKENIVMFKRLRAFLAGKNPRSMARVIEAMEDQTVLESVAENIQEGTCEGAKALVATALKYVQQQPELAADLLEQAIGLMSDSEMPEPEAEEFPAEEPSVEMPNVFEAQAVAYAQDILAEAKSIQEETLRKIEAGRCAEYLEKRLKESALPAVAAEKIRSQFRGQVFSEAVLNSEIKYAKDILAVNGGGQALIESQNPTGYRGPSVQILMEGMDKLAIGANLLFEYPWQQDASLTESEKEVYKTLGAHQRNYSPSALYFAATGDYDRNNRAMPGSLLEAATTASFPNILSTSMNKTLHFTFMNQQPPAWEAWIKQVDLPNLKQIDRHVAGGFTTLPSVAQSGTYQDLGVPLELPTNYTLGKYGGYFAFSEECVFNDDLGYFQTIIPGLKDAGLDTRERLAYNLLIGNVGGTVNGDTSYDSLTHYHAAHDNLGSSALAHASLVTAVQSVMRTRKISFRTTISTDHTDSVTTLTVVSTSGMQVGNYARLGSEIVKITAIGSSTTATIVRAQLGTSAAAATSGAAVIVLGASLQLNAMNAFLVVPIALWNTAKELVESDLLPGGANNNRNILKGMLTVVPVDEQYLGGDANNWFITTSHQLIHGLEIGYFNGQRAPEIIMQDQPSVGTVFTNDEIRYKVKYRVGGRAIMHEGRYGAIVSG